jgi:hypothetical protein|tara:strand:+ start:432 stop:662 length:231 start_codon:yes stop_codon:yes gene_type:complete
MSNENQVVIDGIGYDAEALTESCKNLLIRVQNTNQYMALQTSALEATRIGNDILLSDAKKLLPEPSATDVEDDLAH